MTHKTLKTTQKAITDESVAEKAMRERFKGQPITPCSLNDESAFDAGKPWMAIDSQGNQHLIGSKTKLL